MIPDATERTSQETVPYALHRVGTLMVPDPEDPREVEGVLNPATAWGPDGQLYLFPRLVAAGNVSRVGRARVVVEDGVPVGVERCGVALEPERSWEHGHAHGGVEDPRITTIAALGVHVMTYVAFGPLGPRPALAVSRDLEHWQRLGPLLFEYDDELGTDLNLYPNKDVVLFPEAVPGPDGRPSFAVLHRPMWDFDFVKPDEPAPLPTGVTDERASIWISYVDAEAAVRDLRALTRPARHRFVAGPRYEWEALKIGAGTPPLRVAEGWLVLHHGVQGALDGGGYTPQKSVEYSAGSLVLDPADPSRLLARTSSPLLVPATAEETSGVVPNVVFPTAVEAIEGVLYAFYGMGDAAIGVARLEHL